jgi:hypothetical protein
MDLDRLTRLARERAMNIKNLDELLNIFELTKEQYEQIEQDPTFKRVLEQYNIEWNSALTSPERVRLRSLATYEDGMQFIADRMTNPNEPLASCIEAAKMFAKTGGIGEKKDEIPTAERFVIQINMGENKMLSVDLPSSKEIVPAAITDQSGTE